MVLGALVPCALLQALELLDGMVEQLERFIALPLQILELGFGRLQARLQDGLLPGLPGFSISPVLECQCAGGGNLEASRRAQTMEMLEADVRTIVIISLEHREDDVMIPLKRERLAHLQRFSVDLQGYFGRSVDETVERTRDDHGFSLVIPADDARVLRMAWVKRSMSAVRR